KGAYGTLHVNRDTGAYVFVPADDAIDARQDGGSETFSFTASAGGKTVQKPFTVDVVVPATAPAAPAGPKAAAGPERVDLTWKAPSWTGGAPVTGYRIEQSTDGGTTWSVVEQNTGSTDTRYSAKGLANGREASSRISAVNRNGTGPSSQVITATPLDVPGAPVDVTAAPADRKVEVSWTAPKNDGGAPVTGYRIEQSTDGGTTWTVVEQNTGSTGTRYSAEGLANGRTVSFRIAAINAAGTGKVSNEAAAAPRTVPGAAAGLKAAAGDGQVKLTWTAPEDDGGAPVTGYRIEQYNPETKTWRAAGATKDAKTSYTVTGLPNGVEAAFRVSPVNDAGTGKAGSAAAATPRTVPGAAEITGIEPGNRKLAVEFDGPSSDGGAEITGYEYSLDGGETWNTAGDGSGPLVIDGLNNGEDYSVLVRAVNAAGAGAPSEAVEASPERAPVPDESGTDLPEVPAGDTELLIDGAAEPFTISLENGTWTVTGDGFSIDLEAVNGDGAKLAIDD
ncbi:fibronectin type III domain-containing protein, partial [Arthrobacter deserti]|nr:fibronectin type III domain-containing protein [Arthrobacter deserti]